MGTTFLKCLSEETQNLPLPWLVPHFFLTNPPDEVLMILFDNAPLDFIPYLNLTGVKLLKFFVRAGRRDEIPRIKLSIVINEKRCSSFLRFHF